MGSIIDYAKKYGDLTFKEKAFDEVDSVMFVMLSYINFDGILTHSLKHKVRLEDAIDLFFEKYNTKDLIKDGLGLQSAYKLAGAISHLKRYKDINLYNYVYSWNSEKQFSALFLDIDETNVYISIEGTDDYVSGWKEDFELSYKFPIPSQIECITYLNSSIKLFDNKKYIIAGHSKGGNLALVGAMYLNPLLKKKITKVISYDGPGLRESQINSRKYKNILPKFELVVPNNSVIGLLLSNTTSRTVYLSNRRGIYAHDALSWQVDDDKFIQTELSSYSKGVDKTITSWLSLYDDEKRKRFVVDLFSIFDRCNIESLDKIDPKDLLTLVRETSKIEKESRDMLIELLKIFISYNITSKVGE
ncbi:MAG TPA: DUF2974 domain-containing protein [Bacilli bacterium]|nr:DUF2974 domain-containing protein [Bacilli bacterium]HPZ23238.1 DUF2974 domain-containing protein [Bacilli bacterium]HQC83594.1 DUF2974 domain-containing protein [Bacilli bacterium]